MNIQVGKKYKMKGSRSGYAEILGEVRPCGGYGAFHGLIENGHGYFHVGMWDHSGEHCLGPKSSDTYDLDHEVHPEAIVYKDGSFVPADMPIADAKIIYKDVWVKA